MLRSHLGRGGVGRNLYPGTGVGKAPGGADREALELSTRTSQKDSMDCGG